MKLAIKGTIVANEDKWVYDFLGFEATAPSDVSAVLEEASGEDITMEISSPGGDVIAANEIYYAVATYDGNVTADITGWAASAASYIALAANKVRMLPTAMYMIHNVSGAARGDYHAMDKESKVLKNFNKAVSNAYRLKTGLSESELLSLMDKESWLSASEAKEKGFIDEIIGDSGGSLDNTIPAAIYNSAFSNFAFFPKEKIEALREMLVKNNADDNSGLGTDDNSATGDDGNNDDTGNDNSSNDDGNNTEPTTAEPSTQDNDDGQTAANFVAKIKKSILF